MMQPTLKEFIATEKNSDTVHVSKRTPAKMGNSLPIAYGGCVISLAMSVAVKSVPATFFCYSAQGLFLGPTLISDKVTAVTTSLRDTKTFKTVRVDVKQMQRGVERMTFSITCDFQVKEISVLKYNVRPRFEPPDVEECTDWETELTQRQQSGELDPHMVKEYMANFPLLAASFEVRHCPESIARQNVYGMHRGVKLSRPDLGMLDKTSAYWFRSRERLSHAESYAAIGFVTDAALAFLPATFLNKALTDYGAISTLDLSLRLHTSDFSCNDWLLHEQVTEAANDGRTLSIGRIFRADGVLIATMSQMSIWRPKPAKDAKAKM